MAGLAFDDVRLRHEIEHMEKVHAVELQSAIDSPYPPREWYVGRIERLEQRNAELTERLSAYES